MGCTGEIVLSKKLSKVQFTFLRKNDLINDGYDGKKLLKKENLCFIPFAIETLGH